MDERRKSARRRCLIGARAVFNNRSSTLNCTLRNWSEDGCLLSFGETPYLPSRIELVLDNRETLMPGRIVWRRDHEVGLAFPRSRFFQELRDLTRAARTPAVSRTSAKRLH